MEPFEADGLWWLPDAPDSKTAGTLSVSSEGRAELTLIGAITSLLSSGGTRRERGAVTVAFTEESLARSGAYPRIHGQVDGHAYTLDDCLQTHRKARLGGGLSTEKIIANRVFRGVWLEEGEEASFHSISVWLDWLPYWVMRSGLEEMIDVEERNDGSQAHRSWSITIRRLAEESCQAPRDGRVTLGQSYGISGDGVMERRLTQNFYFSIEKSRLVEVSKLLEETQHVQDLVSIGTGKAAAYSSVELRHPDVAQDVRGAKRELPIQMFARWRVVNDEAVKRLVSDQMFFTFPEFDGLNGLERWLWVASKHRSALSRVMATRYSRTMFVSDQLLNCAAALEAYDRDKHADEVNFADQLRRCSSYVGDPFFKLVGDVNKWAESVKDGRNDVAHHNAGVMEASSRHLFLAQSAYWLFIMCLLRECDAPDVIFERIPQHRRFRWLKRQIANVVAEG